MAAQNQNTAAAQAGPAPAKAPVVSPAIPAAQARPAAAASGPGPALGSGVSAEIKAVRERYLKAAAQVAGPEAAARLRVLVEAGVTVEQFKAFTATTTADKWPELVDSYAAKHGCSKAKAQHAIDVIHPGLRERYLGLPAAAAKSEHTFMHLLRVYKTENNCDASTALHAVDKANPGLHQRFLQDMAGRSHHRRKPTSQSEHEFLTKSYAHAQAHGCGIAEAQLAVDKANPGLRDSFLEACRQR